ncbi:ankyrin repeat domain-containing protein [Wolbachia endosymbiont of Tetranychus urticae]|uniref:ankyrin repeat domain-containing protein n=1 Tax=Wolbachia endosymbiont of Tetranychus urticae TaxID=169184 RepID=UPI00397871F2
MNYSVRDIDSKLLNAAERGDIDEVKHLINEGADVNAKDVYEKTPLHWAAEKGHKEIVEILLKKGANVNSVDF